jgi:hypothetical protein
VPGGQVFAEGFSHYLSYGATDQQTVRQLAGSFDGLLVPGTVASFQREGTGGFVLSLSAATAGTEYVIDPRFPLFQQGLTNPKKSHTALAEILGRPDLVRATDPSPDDFDSDLIETVARSWTDFNGGYQQQAGGKFAKYAERLGEPVELPNAKGPRYILPPYLVTNGPRDPWWTKSQELFEATRRHVNDDDRCVRVVAAASPNALSMLLETMGIERVVVWVNALDELRRSHDELAEYGRAIADFSRKSGRAFALYGGFFGVLLQNVGLSGLSHGIGFGESRAWIELPESGPPPARYYLPQLHRYVQPDEATQLLFADERLANCDCEDCGGEPPIALDYRALMSHSVRCRASEIASWSGLSGSQAVERLGRETILYDDVLHASGLSQIIISRTERQMRHLFEWRQALELIGQG